MRVQLKTKKLKLKTGFTPIKSGFTPIKLRFNRRISGFTLIELLIAMVIIGILATVGLGSFRTAQMRGRDGERKSDLKQISNALELYYSDYGAYPLSDLPWEAELKDSKNTTYMKIVPKDPGGGTYVYQVSSTGKKYRLFAHLENTEDKNIITGITASCGTALTCNFSITSANTTPTETW